MGKNRNEGQSGGVNISGSVGSVRGDIVGGNKVVSPLAATELDDALRPLVQAISAAPPETQSEAFAKLEELKTEVAKGKDAKDSLVARLVDGLVGLVPDAASAVVNTFATPILAQIGGDAAAFVLDRLRGN
ncbi:hypothetical protein GCT13_28760 [Paraburkholderia sp. CNPSo 3157]|uniref:Uncharacterized protein n=1 Tax=Paraburkholderia franconis TaxID=2654983 RepID=A0A7X1TIJ6_9BURK|nr:hypothetical protein [Paraburkholderia franconis]MPW20757.1 hypothetical protein [Paraburkholderia franconis]